MSDIDSKFSKGANNPKSNQDAKVDFNKDFDSNDVHDEEFEKSPLKA
jgi:hypothetical protein